MMPFICRTLLLLALASIAGGTLAGEAKDAWLSRYGRDAPLVGQIWSLQDHRRLDQDQLLARLKTTDFILLGEKHDNADDHRLQAWLVAALGGGDRKPVLAFEMLTRDQAPALATFLQSGPKDASGLGPAVGWADSGWPDWSLYQPIADAALAAHLPIVAANLSKAELAGLRHGDAAAALGPERASRLGLASPLPPAQEQAMDDELGRDHCGMLPAKAMPAMVRVQRARDAALAEALADHADKGGGILIAGGGHVRRDRGVPVVLHRLRPQATVASLAFIEAPTKATDPDFADLPFDYVWYTPRSDDQDACEKFKDQLQQMKR